MNYAEVKDNLQNTPRTWLVTGVAGFIGSNLLEALLRLDQVVVGAEDVVEIRVGDVGGQHRWIIDEFEMVVPRLAHAAQ